MESCLCMAAGHDLAVDLHNQQIGLELELWSILPDFREMSTGSGSLLCLQASAPFW